MQDRWGPPLAEPTTSDEEELADLASNSRFRWKIGRAGAPPMHENARMQAAFAAAMDLDPPKSMAEPALAFAVPSDTGILCTCPTRAVPASTAGRGCRHCHRIFASSAVLAVHRRRCKHGPSMSHKHASTLCPTLHACISSPCVKHLHRHDMTTNKTIGLDPSFFFSFCVLDGWLHLGKDAEVPKVLVPTKSSDASRVTVRMQPVLQARMAPQDPEDGRPTLRLEPVVSVETRALKAAGGPSSSASAVSSAPLPPRAPKAPKPKIRDRFTRAARSGTRSSAAAPGAPPAPILLDMEADQEPPPLEDIVPDSAADISAAPAASWPAAPAAAAAEPPLPPPVLKVAGKYKCPVQVRKKNNKER